MAFKLNYYCQMAENCYYWALKVYPKLLGSPPITSDFSEEGKCHLTSIIRALTGFFSLQQLQPPNGKTPKSPLSFIYTRVNEPPDTSRNVPPSYTSQWDVSGWGLPKTQNFEKLHGDEFPITQLLIGQTLRLRNTLMAQMRCVDPDLEKIESYLKPWQ